MNEAAADRSSRRLNYTARAPALASAEADPEVVEIKLDLGPVQPDSHRLEILNRMGRLLVAELELDKIMQAVTDAGVELTGAELGAFFSNSGSGDSYRLMCLSGVLSEAVISPDWSIGSDLFGAAEPPLQIMRRDDAEAQRSEGRMPPFAERLAEGTAPLRSCLAVPVGSRCSGLVGILLLGHSEPGRFVEHHEETLAGVAAQAALCIDNARLHDHMRREVEERRRVEAALLEKEARLVQLADSIPQIVWERDEHGDLVFLNRRWQDYTGFSPAETMAEGNGREVLHEDDRPRFAAAWSAATATGSPLSIECRLRHKSGRYRWFLLRATPGVDPENGRIVHWYGTATDINDARLVQDERALLTAELAHRGKNTLAMISAITRQTLHQADSLEAAEEALLARYMVLAQAHDSLTSTDWRGASLGKVVDDALVAHRGQAGRFMISGPEIHLPAKQVLALSLALHELATNAVKYGALSLHTGIVEVSWSVEDKGGAPELRLRWIESGGPAVVEPTTQGFGSRLIERNLAMQFAGRAKLHFDPAGVVFDLCAPLAADGGVPQP
ncbi:sensor histidine kinase [Consotaella aegiceratis]|uniref:sensor histidine kinase n=1 Tax=Consotaella aegiceratis TaxID=3097961 RepID=UPI002F3E5E1D